MNPTIDLHPADVYSASELLDELHRLVIHPVGSDDTADSAWADVGTVVLRRDPDRKLPICHGVYDHFSDMFAAGDSDALARVAASFDARCDVCRG